MASRVTRQVQMQRESERDGAGAAAVSWRDRRWLAAGVGWGAAATVAMTALMLAGTGTGVSPMPKPISVALVGHTFGALPTPASRVLGRLAHLGYGMTAGLVMVASTRRVNVWRGLGFGVTLWLLMGQVFLPYLGWGLFGTSLPPAIAGATLVLHLVYGGTLGALLGRRHPDEGALA